MMDDKVFELYCPACGTLMNDVTFIGENGFEYPEKQCPNCKTIYQLGSESDVGAHSPQEIILAPRSKKWLKKHGKKHFKGVLPNSW